MVYDVKVTHEVMKTRYKDKYHVGEIRMMVCGGNK